jgi:hypothetical protein
MRLYLARSCMMPSTSGSCCCESETSLGMSNVMERLHIGHLHGCSTELCCHTLNMHSPAKYNIHVRKQAIKDTYPGVQAHQPPVTLPHRIDNGQ